MSLSLIEACNATTFDPVLFGAQILTLEADVVTNYSASVPEAFRYIAPAVELQNASFCNVTLSYTHPGQDDEIFVEAWLPLESWNGRFQAVGGGGWVAGRFSLAYGAMKGALADGFATITTDAGLGNAMEASPWALSSPGNVNWNSLQNPASRSLNDEVLSPCIIFLLKLSLTNLISGYPWQITDQELLRQRTRVFVLERLFTGWSARSHAGPEIPQCVRRYSGWRAGNSLDRVLSKHPMAAAGHE